MGFFIFFILHVTCAKIGAGGSMDSWGALEGLAGCPANWTLQDPGGRGVGTPDKDFAGGVGALGEGAAMLRSFEGGDGGVPTPRLCSSL